MSRTSLLKWFKQLHSKETNVKSWSSILAGALKFGFVILIIFYSLFFLFGEVSSEENISKNIFVEVREKVLDFLGFEDDINISSAVHLNEDKGFISDIFDGVKALDGIWSEPIFANEFVKVVFEENLTYGKVIDFYARDVNEANFSVEIYSDNWEFVGASKFFNSTGEWDYILVDNLNISSNTFYFKIINEGSFGFLEFDFIHDATRFLTDINLTSSSNSIVEGDEINVTGYYSTSATGGPTGDVKIGLNDTNNHLLLDMNCSSGDTFKIGSIIQSLCVGCTDNADGTITLTNPDNNEEFVLIWNLTSCSDSSDYSPANIQTYEVTTTGAVLDNSTGDINISGAPSIEIIYPVNGETYNTNDLFIRFSTTGNNFDSCWYNLNSGGNVTFNCSIEPNITAIEGDNNLSVYVNNTGGLEASDEVNFSVNSSIPLTIAITSPENNTIKTSSTPQLKLLALDKDFSSINYTTYIYFGNDTLYSVGNNGTLTNNSESEITLSPSLVLIENSTVYKILVNATDGTNNASSNLLYYTVTLPLVTLISPVNGYWTNQSNILFNFSVMDEAYSNISCSLQIDGVVNQTNETTLSDNTVTWFNVSGIAEGQNKIWKINCTDASNNTGDALRYFNVDETSPVVNWVNETPNPVNAESIINLTANVTDNFGVDEVIVNISGIDYFMISFENDLYYYEYNATNLSGDYNYSVRAYDNAGNGGINDTGSFFVNIFYWSNSSEYPEDPADYVPGANYEFNISLSCEDLDSVWIEFDGTNYTEVVNYSEVYHFNISNLSVGVYNYTWWANDSGGVIGSSSYNYTIVALPDYRLNGTVINGTGDALNVSFKIYNSTGNLIYENDEIFDYVFSGVEKYKFEVIAHYDHYVNKFWLNGLFNNSNLTNPIYAGHNQGKAHCIVDPSLLNYDGLVMEKKPNNPETQILDKCNGVYNLTTYTCNGTWEPWYKIHTSDFANYTFAWGDPALRDGSGTFFEDWETGLLTTNNWSSSGGTNNWIVVTEDPYAGVYHAQAEATVTESILTTNISTVGYENISFDFYYDTDALDGGEYLRADWYNGTDWINVLDVITNTVDYTKNSNNLTSDANNNSNFAIRFRCLSSTNNEECKVDNIFVNGDSLDNCICTNLTNWDVDMSDYCVLNSPCNLTGYNLTFTGIGNFTVNSTLYVNEIKNLSLGMTMWMKQNGFIIEGVV